MFKKWKTFCFLALVCQLALSGSFLEAAKKKTIKMPRNIKESVEINEDSGDQMTSSDEKQASTLEDKCQELAAAIMSDYTKMTRYVYKLKRDKYKLDLTVGVINSSLNDFSDEDLNSLYLQTTNLLKKYSKLFDSSEGCLDVNLWENNENGFGELTLQESASKFTKTLFNRSRVLQALVDRNISKQNQDKNKIKDAEEHANSFLENIQDHKEILDVWNVPNFGTFNEKTSNFRTILTDLDAYWQDSSDKSLGIELLNEELGTVKPLNGTFPHGHNVTVVGEPMNECHKTIWPEEFNVSKDNCNEAWILMSKDFNNTKVGFGTHDTFHKCSKGTCFEGECHEPQKLAVNITDGTGMFNLVEQVEGEGNCDAFVCDYGSNVTIETNSIDKCYSFASFSGDGVYDFEKNINVFMNDTKNVGITFTTEKYINENLQLASDEMGNIAELINAGDFKKAKDSIFSSLDYYAEVLSCDLENVIAKGGIKKALEKEWCDLVRFASRVDEKAYVGGYEDLMEVVCGNVILDDLLDKEQDEIFNGIFAATRERITYIDSEGIVDWNNVRKKWISSYETTIFFLLDNMQE